MDEGTAPTADTPLESPASRLPAGHNLTPATLDRVDRAVKELYAAVADLKVMPEEGLKALDAPYESLLRGLQVMYRASL